MVIYLYYIPFIDFIGIAPGHAVYGIEYNITYYNRDVNDTSVRIAVDETSLPSTYFIFDSCLYSGDYNYDYFKGQSAGTYTFTVSQFTTTTYAGYSVYTVYPSDTVPGDKTITLTLYTENPYGPDYSVCEWTVTDPFSNTTAYTTESNGLTHQLTHTFNYEGIYLVEYNCHVLLTSPIVGTLTVPVIVEDPAVPSLDGTVEGLPHSLSAPEEINIVVTLTDDAAIPVDVATCYVEYNNTVTTYTTDLSGQVAFTLTLYPDTLFKLTCYKSGYHPWYYEHYIASASMTTPVSGGGGGGGSVTLPSEQLQETISTEESVTSQQQSTLSASQLPVSPGLIGVLIVLAILYYILRRRG